MIFATFPDFGFGLASFLPTKPSYQTHFIFPTDEDSHEIFCSCVIFFVGSTGWLDLCMYVSRFMSTF